MSSSSTVASSAPKKLSAGAFAAALRHQAEASPSQLLPGIQKLRFNVSNIHSKSVRLVCATCTLSRWVTDLVRLTSRQTQAQH